MAFEEEFSVEIPDDAAETIRTVGDAVSFITKNRLNSIKQPYFPYRISGHSMRRVVVTGMGMVSPLGNGVETSWSRLKAGQSGAVKVSRFDVSDLASQIACEVPRGDGANGTFNPDDWMDKKDQRKADEFILFGVAAATQAWKIQAGYQRPRMNATGQVLWLVRALVASEQFMKHR